MPAEAPLAMPCQDLARPFVDRDAPAASADRRAIALRLLMVMATAGVGGYFTFEMTDILAKGGLSPLELVMGITFAASFVWIALAAVNASGGATIRVLKALRRRRGDRAETVPPLSVAIIVPTCDEPPDQVFGNAVAMLTSLARQPTRHSFALYVLSDTTREQTAAAEHHAFHAALRRLPSTMAMYYRRRGGNAGRKAGNVADWCRRWGGRHEAMIVLDADSLMDEAGIIGLADALAADPSAGLIQSVPRLVHAHTLFARAQQFAAAAYGLLLAEGMGLWSRGEANYWGHNAIIRIRAFVSSAGLPELAGRRPFGGYVLSHDFVEAALMRRAGWRVRLIPRIGGSYEESPPTLVDHVVRDRRWCQGNLQHIGVVGAVGLHPVSRFHLFQGVMTYLSSVLWLVFLAAGTALAIRARSMPVDYFPEPHVLFPSWPIIDSERAYVLLALTAVLLLMPKILGILAILARPGEIGRWGGLGTLLVSAATEVVLSALLAPILMIRQTFAVARIFAGHDGGWRPQQREAGSVRLSDLIRFHLVETGIGIVLTLAMAFAIVPLWLAPVAVSLLLAVPLSALSTVRPLPRHRSSRLFTVPERSCPPPVLRAARANRAAMRAELRRANATAASIRQGPGREHWRVRPSFRAFVKSLQKPQPGHASR